ncbi:Putative glycosyltransferase EpsH [Vibrio thalassae]|uniref:Glycosyltransferase EpsH n=1 Tax=Vibrio thalassae TaxID=1243014 RepID=A0A240END4_9VIBR|nr:Putative glycosyltransferase EpsH [Vibrio thalassae]
MLKIKKKIKSKINGFASYIMSIISKNYFSMIRLIRPHYTRTCNKYPVVKVILKPLVYVNLLIRSLIYRKKAKYSSIHCSHNNYFIKENNTDEIFEPLVSIIVPNYNHEPYLRERLESIYKQTYKNYEVILLDDVSTDRSREILSEYAEIHSDKTRLVVNESNSGSVFKQWNKGLLLARGELIWIAESDDFCSYDFVASLVSTFEDESVMLAFSNTIFVRNEEEIWSLNEYLFDIDTINVENDFVLPSQYLFENGFTRKNIIPNVSSAMFRKPHKLTLLEDESWRQMKVCGDWVFYAEIAKGGCIAYQTAPTNYYRQHDGNISVTSHKLRKFYEEHYVVLTRILNIYTVSDDEISAHISSITSHFKSINTDIKLEDIEAIYEDKVFLQEVRNNKKPKILMVGYAFVSGGGETFPIQLANLFKNNGFTVTFLNCNEAKTNPGIRKLLSPDIPVVNNIFEINGIVRDFDIDVIHSHHAWVDMNIIDLLDSTSIKNNKKAKHVVSMHGMYEMLDDNVKDKIVLRLHDKAHRLVYAAEKNLQPLVELGLQESKKLVKVENALQDLPINTIERHSLGIPESAFVLCLVSRAIPDKGWQEAVDAVTVAIKNSPKEIYLLMIGDGPEKDRLSKVTLHPNIRLLGFANNIRDYFSMADIGFLPSKFKGESYPLVIIDCIRTGTPMLASNIGEIKNMLSSRNGDFFAGELFELDNWQINTGELANLILSVANSEKDYSVAVADIKDKFSPNVLFERMQDIYISEEVDS